MVVEFDIVAPLFFEVARSGFSVADDDCTDSRKRTLAAREDAGCDETDPAGSPIFTVDELAMHPSEFGKLAARHNLVEIAEPRRREADVGTMDGIRNCYGRR